MKRKAGEQFEFKSPEFKSVAGTSAHGRANKISPALGDNDTMPFGRHKGELMIDVPDKYLLWLFEQEWLPKDWPAVYGYIHNSYEALKD